MKTELKNIIENGSKVREFSDGASFEQLVASIKEQGVIVPIKVRPSGDEFEIVYGNRRFQAAKEAGLTEVDIILEDLDDATSFTQGLTENVVRKDMTPYEVAIALQRELRTSGKTQEEVGKMYGMDRTTVINYLSLLKYEVLTGQHLGVKHVIQAEAGAGKNKELAADVLEKAVNENLSTRQTREVAEAMAKTTVPEIRAEIKRLPLDSGSTAKSILSRAVSFAGDAAGKRLTARGKMLKDVGEKEVAFSWSKTLSMQNGLEGVRYVGTLIDILGKADKNIKASDHPDGDKVRIVSEANKHLEILVGYLENLTERAKGYLDTEDENEQ